MTRNTHVPEPFRSILNNISRSHADAREELADTIASLNRSANMPKPMTPATTTSKAHPTMPTPPNEAGAAVPAVPEAPVVDDNVWDETIAQYVTRVSRGDRVYTITTATTGPFTGDYEIHGPDGYHSPGWTTLDRAIACATDQLLDHD